MMLKQVVLAHFEPAAYAFWLMENPKMPWKWAILGPKVGQKWVETVFFQK